MKDSRLASSLQLSPRPRPRGWLPLRLRGRTSLGRVAARGEGQPATDCCLGFLCPERGSGPSPGKGGPNVHPLPHWLQLPALSSDPFLGRVHTEKHHGTLLSPCTPTPCALPRCPGSRARNTLPKSHPGLHPQDPDRVATQWILELSQEAHRVLWPPRSRRPLCGQ